MLSPAAAMRLLRAHALTPVGDAISQWMRNHRSAAKPKLAEFLMYDSITLDAIPVNARAVAGYVNGRWPTFHEIEKRWPRAKRLSIAVTAAVDADCLDVENGDASPEQAPAWVRRQHARGVERPAVYCSVSISMKVRWLLLKAGIRRPRYRLITAHYTGKPHRCSPLCRFGFLGRADATQYTDRALGRDLDASVCHPDFL